MIATLKLEEYLTHNFKNIPTQWRMKEKSDYLVIGFLIANYTFREKITWTLDLHYIVREILYQLQG